MKTIIAFDINIHEPSKVTIIQTKESGPRVISRIENEIISSRYMVDIHERVEDILSEYYQLVREGKTDLEIYFDVPSQVRDMFVGD